MSLPVLKNQTVVRIALELCLPVETAPMEKRNKSRIFLEKAIFIRDNTMSGTDRRMKSKAMWIALNAGTTGFWFYPPGRLVHSPNVQYLEVFWKWYAYEDVDQYCDDGVEDQEAQECVMENHPLAGGHAGETTIEENDGYLDHSNGWVEHYLPRPHQLRERISPLPMALSQCGKGVMAYRQVGIEVRISKVIQMVASSTIHRCRKGNPKIRDDAKNCQDYCPVV